MTMTTGRSGYNDPIEDLVPKARALADELGATPSCNQLETHLRIGAPEANALLDQLAYHIPKTRAADTDSPPKPVFSVSPPVSDPDPAVSAESGPAPCRNGEPAALVPQVPTAAEPIVPATDTTSVRVDELEPVKSCRRLATWPVLLLMLPATVAIWSGWVGLGSLAGFGPVHPLPGIADSFVINTAITLPIGMETYSAYALYVWLSGRAGPRAIAFARASALLALVIGAAGQIFYHLMSAANVPAAHPLITAGVACIPVAVLGLGAALAHLVREDA